jgi:hypothetical protein
LERTIFIGDVHGCAEEFEEMLDAVAFVKEEDRLFLTGDAFTKGPDPLAVWQLIWDTGAEMVMGNHDSGFRARCPQGLGNQANRIWAALSYRLGFGVCLRKLFECLYFGGR